MENTEACGLAARVEPDTRTISRNRRQKEANMILGVEAVGCRTILSASYSGSALL
jgi:hypothetical protein